MVPLTPSTFPKMRFGQYLGQYLLGAADPLAGGQYRTISMKTEQTGARTHPPSNDVRKTFAERSFKSCFEFEENVKPASPRLMRQPSSSTDKLSPNRQKSRMFYVPRLVAKIRFEILSY